MFLLAPQIIYSIDYLLLPFFLVFWIGVMTMIKHKKYKGTEIEKYFMPALYARFLGAFLSAAMYQYYYGMGDTFYYFWGAQDIYNAILGNPSAAYEMLFYDHFDWSPDTIEAVRIRLFFTNEKEALVVKIAGVFSVFGLGTYLGTSFSITAFSFLGCWALFRVFYQLYPHLHKELSWAILFLPSMCFWSTGIMKDSLVIAGLGFFVYGIYYGIISKKKKLIRSIFLIIMGALLMKNIKVYVLLSILPATIVWVFFMYKEKIKNPTIRKIASPIFFIAGGLGGVFFIQQLGNTFSEYTLEGFLYEATKMQWWLKLSTERDGGTGYDLGELDPSMMGLLKVFPKAVNVTLFRPYLWEARKIIVIPSAIESFVTLLLTFYVIYKVGIFKILGSILSDPVILFCLIFSIIFAFAVGFTSYNFGALARYKIPCLPFYYTAMILLLNKLPGKKQVKEVPQIQSPT